MGKVVKLISRKGVYTLFSNRDLKKLILPLIIEQFLAVAIGLADTAMVASCGESAVSGISLVDSINFLLIMLFSSLATGGAVVVSQYIGKREKRNATIVAKQLEYAAFAISLVLAVLAAVFRDPVIRTVFGDIEPAVMDSASTYFLLSAISYPFLAVYNSGAALFRAMGDSKTSMMISVLMNVLNVVGNAVTIFGFGWGVFGAALSTLISRIVGAVLITILLLNPDRAVFLDKLWKPEFNLGMIKKILQIGVPNGLENSIFQIGKILTMSIVSSLGTAAITANAVTGSYANLQNIPGSAIGMALVTITGQCVGAGKYDEAVKFTKKLLKITYVACWSITVILILFLPLIKNLYSLSDTTFELMTQSFFIHAGFAVAIWPLSFMLPNTLRAAGDAKYTMAISLISMWVFRIALSYLFVYTLGIGLAGIWLAMCIDWVFRSIMFLIRFFNGKWKGKALV